MTTLKQLTLKCIDGLFACRRKEAPVLALLGQSILSLSNVMLVVVELAVKHASMLDRFILRAPDRL